MKLYKILTLLFAILLINACTDLDTEIEDYFIKDYSIRKEKGGEKDPVNLSAAFSTLRAGNAGHGSQWAVNGVSSDEMAVTAKGGDWFDGGIWIDVHQHAFVPTSDPLNESWKNQYKGIAECNRLLGESTIIADGNAVAQLKVIRAFFYYRLLDMFGNVKLITESAADPAQSTREEVYTFVEDELVEAIKSGNLATSPADKYEAGEWAAWGLLARLRLNAEVYTGTADWTGAITAADKVIDNSGASLHPVYAEVFAADNDGNQEHVWAIRYDEVDGAGMNFSHMTLHYGSQATWGLDAQPWNGYVALEEFYNSYDASDDRKANFIVGEQKDQDGKPIIDLASEGVADPDGLALNYTPEINELFPNALRQGGTRLGKFMWRDGGSSDMSNDMPIIRIGDVLLIKAEATARMNNDFSDATTLALVNQVKGRAFTTYTPLTSLTEAEFLEERGREMFMEQTRRTDLIRFGQWGSAWWEKDAHSDTHKNVFPIPLTQIKAASAEGNNPLSQNPGY